MTDDTEDKEISFTIEKVEVKSKTRKLKEPNNIHWIEGGTITIPPTQETIDTLSKLLEDEINKTRND